MNAGDRPRPTTLDVDRFLSLLTGPLGADVRYLVSTTSTNRDALEWAANGAPHGAVVVAGEQSAGRGRWGRSWISPPGAGLLFSVVLRIGEGSTPHLVTTAAGVATALAIETSTRLGTRLKWPNDVLVGGRKVAGILVESRSGAERLAPLVCGIGINLRHRAQDLPPDVRERATSLAQEGAPIDPEALLASTLDRLAERLGALSDPSAAAGLLEEATERSEVLGRRVRVVASDGSTSEGLAVGLTPEGALLVGIDGKDVVIRSGEIERIRVAGEDEG